MPSLGIWLRLGSSFGLGLGFRLGLTRIPCSGRNRRHCASRSHRPPWAFPSVRSRVKVRVRIPYSHTSTVWGSGVRVWGGSGAASCVQTSAQTRLIRSVISKSVETSNSRSIRSIRSINGIRNIRGVKGIINKSVRCYIDKHLFLAWYCLTLTPTVTLRCISSKKGFISTCHK